MQTVRASLRVHAVGVAILLCLTLAFVALTSKDTVPRIFFALFCLVLTGISIAVYRKESALAQDHLVVRGTVTELTKGRRGGRGIKYQFVAFDGKQYRGESDWGAQRVQVGSEVLVLYQPLNPAVNLPVTRSLFYSFRSYGSE